MTMRFEDVSDRLNIVLDHPGRPEHGKSLSLAVPNIARMRIWNAAHGGYSWSIVFEPGSPSWSEKDKAEHVGYTASYRLTRQNNSSQTIRIDGGPWDSFAKAEEACSRTWRQIRNAS